MQFKRMFVPLFYLSLIFCSTASMAQYNVCRFNDFYYEATTAKGEAEIVQMYWAYAAAIDEVKCEFVKGDEIAVVIIINDWPGGKLNLQGKIFYCNRPEDVRCVEPGLDFGYIPQGDYRLVITTTAPDLFPKPVCMVDIAVRILKDGKEWDIGGLAPLAPGKEKGPYNDCRCVSIFNTK